MLLSVMSKLERVERACPFRDGEWIKVSQEHWSYYEEYLKNRSAWIGKIWIQHWRLPWQQSRPLARVVQSGGSCEGRIVRYGSGQAAGSCHDYGTPSATEEKSLKGLYF